MTSAPSSQTNSDGVSDEPLARSDILTLKAVSDQFISVAEEAVFFNRQVFDFVSTGGDKIKMYKRARHYISLLLSHTQEIFSIYTKSHCAVCIKLLTDYVGLENEERNANLYTLVRDDHPDNARRKKADEILRSYPFSKNYAFIKAINEGYFHCNDLKKLEEKGIYFNERTDWYEYYNATAVYVISAPKTTPNESFIGFLCVDNRNGRFDDGFCKSLLGILSFLVYDVLQMTAFLDAQNVSNQASGEV